MPNLISVTQRGTPQDYIDGISFLKKGGLVNAAPEPVKRFAGDALRAAREVRAVASANPIVYAANELFFPKPVAGGELTEALNKFGPSAVRPEPFGGTRTTPAL